ncbi:hypothetical protein INQ51_21560 [Maribellus sp. CM-23]|uniref:hypothetical protein n=1 Tax=Maribellus sp. CM-23 TaxID=2781026 RepID=UPI001F1A28EF|nr:hypothetical protein [Maribellus sp. CM-23]MCE4566924.1 hypothetical protein [Maribellus sp. CM-23]
MIFKNISSCSWVKYKYDRAISGSWSRQIKFLFAIILLWFILLFIGSLFFASNIQTNNFASEQIEHVQEEIQGNNVIPGDDFNSSMDSRFWGIFSQFIDPGNVHMANKNRRWYAAFVALIGVVFFNGLLISTLSNMLERRVDRIKAGLIRYKLKNHLLILGYEDYIIAVIKNFTIKNPGKKIIIQTSAYPADLSKRINILLDEKERKSILYYQCNRDSSEDIGQMYPEYASSIYILGEVHDRERDNKNLFCFKQIQNRIGKSFNEKYNGNESNIPLPIYLFIEDHAIYDITKDYNLERRDLINYRLVNYYEEWSRRIFADPQSIHPDKNDLFRSSVPAEKFQKNSKNKLEIIIVGFNTMGQSIARNAVRLLHLLNHSTTKITIIDKRANELFEEFSTNYPGFELLYDIEFNTIQNNFFSKQVQDYIQNIHKQKEIIPYIIITLGNTSEAFKLALNLPKAVFESKTPVWVRQEIAEGGELLKSAKIPPKELEQAERNNVYANLFFFGMLDTELMALNDYQTREHLAKTAHNTYLEAAAKMNWLVQGEPNKPDELPYEELAEMYKWSNRHLADSYILKLRSLGYFLIENKGYDDSLYEEVRNIDEDNKEAMAQSEHARYVGERIMARWTHGPRNDDFKTHPDILTWENLSITNHQVQDYDRELVLNMIRNLNENGFIVLKEKKRE